jgi:hypothetical protein
MSQSMHDMLINVIADQKLKEEKSDIWGDSPYKDLVKLQKNNSGNVGEMLINEFCKLSDILASCDGSKTKKTGGGEGDGLILSKTVEIKTAHQGCKGKTFQHELGEHPWKSKYMLFVDISPQWFYITIFKNFDEETYKSKKKLPSIFTTKSFTWRKGEGDFKFDTSVNLNEKSIKDGNTIKVIQTTPSEDIVSFIRKIIVD